jgi:hypothetical protein
MNHENIAFVQIHQNVVKSIRSRQYDEAAMWVEKLEEFLDEASAVFPPKICTQIGRQIDVLRTFRRKLERPSLLMTMFGGSRLKLMEFSRIMECMALDVFVPYLANQNVDLLRWTLGGAGGDA